LPQFPESYRLHGSNRRLIGRRNGFTLLELLLVVTVLSAVAWMSLGVVNNNSDQVRFEDTRNRLQAIRRAIIGDASRTINGQPEVRGYVADMGRLPNNLQELTTQGSQPDYAQDATTGLWRGWNGPYLPPGFGSAGRYLDGWGNNDGSNNYGWVYPGDITTITDLVVQSLGRDGVAGGADYDADYPAAASLLTENEYRHALGIVEVAMDFSAASQCFSCMYSDEECSSNGGEWAFYGKASACVNGSYGTAASCADVDLTWMARHYSCSDPTYTDQFSCATHGGTWQADEGKCIAPLSATGCSSGTLQEVRGACNYPATPSKCEDNGGSWETATYYACSIPSRLTEQACLSASGTWSLTTTTYCMISSAAACEKSDGVWEQTKHAAKSVCEINSAKWQPTEQVCLSIAFIDDGAVAATLLNAGPGTISWNGARTAIAFDFGADTLSHGQAAYAITKGSACPTTVAEVTTVNSFPSGAPLWTSFTYVPGTTISFERKIIQ
jgi:prepilin-type N-terminal cleavage/methylation domain-containing protein